MGTHFNRDPRVAFLIISSTHFNNRILKFFQKITWIREVKNRAPVFFTQGNGLLGDGEFDVKNLHDISNLSNEKHPALPVYQLNEFKKGTFIFDSILGWDQILPNTICALEKILEKEEFDYVIRTNLSSYWNIDNTFKLLNTLPKNGVYAGPVQEMDKLKWVEGDAIIMSLDVVQALLRNRNLLNGEVIDDLAIASALSRLGFSPIDIPRFRVTLHLKRLAFAIDNDLAKSKATYLRKFPEKLLVSANIRCKNPKYYAGFTVRLDPLIFGLIWISQRLYNRKRIGDFPR